VLSVREGFVTPLQTRVDELLRDFQALEKGDAHHNSKQAQAAAILGIPQLTPEEIRQNAAMVVTSLLLLNDLLARVEELMIINEDE